MTPRIKPPIVIHNLSELKWQVAHEIKTNGPDCNLNHLDVSRVTDMSDLFRHTSFTGDISNWDVSRVKIMHGTFADSHFNGDISQWNVGNVEKFNCMFHTSSFTGDISKWDTSSARNMDGMFLKSAFNDDISNWDTTHVLIMACMFTYSPFNGDLSRWDTKSVLNMRNMFSHTMFNGDLSQWDVSNVNNMSNMFSSSIFNTDIARWDISGLRSSNSMFLASDFNQDISKWNTAKITDAYWMFRDSAFNGDLSRWDLSQARTGGMLDTENFQGVLPRLSNDMLGAALHSSFRGTIGSDLNIKTASNIFGSKKVMDEYLKDTSKRGLTRLHIERAMTSNKKPVWCTAQQFKELQSFIPTYKSMGIDQDQWSIYAHQSYIDSNANRDINPAHTEEFDFSVVNDLV